MCCVMPPASLLRHLGAADGVQQRGLAVVYVPHDRDDRRADHKILVLVRFVFLDQRFFICLLQLLLQLNAEVSAGRAAPSRS